MLSLLIYDNFRFRCARYLIGLLLLLKLYLHTVFSSGFNMQETKLDKYKSRTTLNRKYNTCFS